MRSDGSKSEASPAASVRQRQRCRARLRIPARLDRIDLFEQQQRQKPAVNRQSSRCQLFDLCLGRIGRRENKRLDTKARIGYKCQFRYKGQFRHFQDRKDQQSR